MKLPMLALTILIASGVAVPADKPKAKAKPECDSNGLTSSGSGGGRMYQCVDGKFVEDQEAEKQFAEGEAKRRKLFRDMQIRVLTDAEEASAVDYGDRLNIDMESTYLPEQKQKELNNAWYQQRRLQVLAKQKPCEGK